MDAKICDSCGAVIKATDNSKISFHPLSDYTFCGVEYCDLCPDCFTKIKAMAQSYKLKTLEVKDQNGKNRYGIFKAKLL